MAVSIYESARREELLRRIAALSHDRPPRWGRMTAPEMVSHLLEAFRMPSGELTIPRMRMPLRPLVRWLMIYVLPFPKSAPTARQLLSRKPATWETDLAALQAAIARATAPSPGARVGDHPIFGTMSVDDWGALMYKHTDHHLRQFGL